MVFVNFTCPQCKAACKIPDSALGSKVRCPRCTAVFTATREPEPTAVRSEEPVALTESAAPVDSAKLAQITAELTQGEEKARPLSLERVPWAWGDRLMPRRSETFLAAVVIIAVVVWAIAFLLAPYKGEFLASAEWQMQPIFLAVHFICLRLFVTCYTRNFLAAACHMDMPAGEAVGLVRRILGPIGGAVALALAIPLCVMNGFYLFSNEYSELAEFEGGAVGPCGLFLWFVWAVEWLLNAYIWVMLVGFSMLTIRTLRRFRFRSTIEVLLHEKQYRPFLMMSAQGASVVLFFGIVNGFYVWYAQGELSDYIGLGVTGLLLLLGFAPPWLQLKASVEQAVDAEVFKLQADLVEAMRHRAANPDQEVTVAELGNRLDLALSILRSSYLEKMHAELGRAEGKAILLKLLIPASSAAWKFLRPMLGI